MLSKGGHGPRISRVTPGRIVDAGITDANNMGAAMAPAAYDTLSAHFKDTGRTLDYYDAIFTGDLGAIGHDILQELFRRDGIELGMRYMDCGVLIYDLKTQDVHAGGLGLRMQRLGARRAYSAGDGARSMEARALCGDGGAHVPGDLPAGVQHPGDMPRGRV